jgi:hypothetical protein
VRRRTWLLHKAADQLLLTGPAWRTHDALGSLRGLICRAVSDIYSNGHIQRAPVSRAWSEPPAVKFLLVAAGEQEELRPVFASRQAGTLARFLVRKRHLLGHGCHPGGTFWPSRRADGLRAVFLLLACCYQEEARPGIPTGNRGRSRPGTADKLVHSLEYGTRDECCRKGPDQGGR